MQSQILFNHWFAQLAKCTPGFLELGQAMSNFGPIGVCCLMLPLIGGEEAHTEFVMVDPQDSGCYKQLSYTAEMVSNLAACYT